MLHLLVAMQYSAGVGLAIVIALALAIGLWGPYLYREIVRGKARVGGFPPGTGDTHPGRRGDPAPGQPDAQPDPYDTINQR